MKANFFALNSQLRRSSLRGNLDHETVRKDSFEGELRSEEEPGEVLRLRLTVRNQTDRSGTMFRSAIEVDSFLLPFSLPSFTLAAASVAIAKGERVVLAHGPEHWVGYGHSFSEAWDNLFVGPGEGAYPRTVLSPKAMGFSAISLSIFPFHREAEAFTVQLGTLNAQRVFAPLRTYRGPARPI